MSDLNQLDTGLLLSQSQEMLSLKAAYDDLFANIAQDLQGINSNWSSLLANNFAGKISSAQRTFLGTLGMLQNSAGSAAMVANAFAEFDMTQAAKIMGVDNISLENMGGKAMSALLNSELGKRFVEQFGDAFSEDSLGDMYDKLPSSVKAWIKKLKKDAIKDYLKNNLNSDDSKVVDAIESALKLDWDAVIDKYEKGDYLGIISEAEGVMGDVGEIGVEMIIEAVAEAQGLALDSADLGQYVKYTINLIEDGTEAATECLLGEPTIGKALNFAWSVTGKPVLDTAGDKVYKVINLIPNISEFYADRGATDATSMANVAMQELYRLATGSDEGAEYVGNYYENHGGLAGGLDNFFGEVYSFVKDSGGIGNAAKAFTKTAITDMQDMFAYQAETANMFWNSMLNRNSGSSGGAGQAF